MGTRKVPKKNKKKKLHPEGHQIFFHSALYLVLDATKATCLMFKAKSERRRSCTRELHFIGHTITASYVQKGRLSACSLLTGKKKHTFLTARHGIHTDK